MDQTIRTVLVAIGTIVAGAILLLGGMYIGRSSWGMPSVWPGRMISGNDASSPGRFHDQMGAYWQIDRDNHCYGYGMMGSYGMMGGGMMSRGMMGGLGVSGLVDVDPLSVTDTQAAVREYLAGLNNADLEIGEVMVFDNHAYAQIVEASSGIGAMEVLINPVTKAVYPEHGPNMMWNLKYSPMSDDGMISMMGGYDQNGRGMMGGFSGSQPPEGVSADMPVSPDQAVAAAQAYLDAYLPGAEADEHADPFYGYYTLHVLRGGEVVGMLSVNGFTRQVFPHTWHGDFVEMAEGDHG